MDYDSEDERTDEHLALIYGSEDNRFGPIASFIERGLSQGEQCVYVTDATEEALAAFRDSEIDVAAARDREELLVRSPAEVGLADRNSRADTVAGSMDVIPGSDEGLEGARLTVEMSDVLSGDADPGTVARHERFFEESGEDRACSVLCQYSRDQFGPDVLTEVVRCHPIVLRGDGVPRPPYRGENDRANSVGSAGRGEGPGAGSLRSDRNEPAVAPIPRTSTDPVRILYVDDEPGYAETAAGFLELETGIDTVVTETDPRAALERIDEEPIDCVVSDYDMPGLTGLDLLESVRETHPNLPFLLVTGQGDEGVASEAISAGVTDYIRKRRGTKQYPVLAHRVSKAVEQYRTEREITRTQRRFSRLIEESTDVIAVLDESGRFEFVSRVAERRLGYPAAELVGKYGHEYIHPDDRSTVQKQFNRLIDGPAERISTEFRFRQPDGSCRWLEARCRDLRDDPDIGGVVVYARDITDRKERERALRESEGRFRSLFEETFDAMVIADDDGAYVDANPAACELFELSRDELLGRSIADFMPDDPDFEAAWQQFPDSNLERGTVPIVGAEGTERVVEFCATPNVVPGEHLSVLRDVTDREEYEDTLNALHDASRTLLSAESKTEVAESIVETAADLLSMSTVVYLFDTDEGRLDPVAANSESIDCDSLCPLLLEGDDLVGSTFLEGAPRWVTDVDDNRAPKLSELSLRSALLFPLGDHGVVIIGDPASGMTDDERELGEILTAAAETALDRVAKEAELRERQRELETQNRKLKRRSQINAIIRRIDTSLLEADTRAEIERVVCEQLSSRDDIDAVWIGDCDPQQRQVVPREWAGSDQIGHYLDRVALSLDEGSEPATRAAVTGEPVHVDNVARRIQEAGWRRTALSDGFRSVVSIPLKYNRIDYGVLTIYGGTPGFVDEPLRTRLHDLGNRISTAISSVEFQQAVLSGTVTEVRLRLTDESLPLYQIASEADCSLALECVEPRPEGDHLTVTVTGTSPATVVDAARRITVVSDATVTVEGEREGEVELQLSTMSIVNRLSDRGVHAPAFTVDAQAATLTLLVPETVDVGELLGVIETQYAEPDLLVKRRRNRTETATEQRVGERYRSKLTPRQSEVLRTAHREGFFESPRECTAEELANKLDIAPQTFYRHIRAVERQLFDIVFDDG
ncbi:MAG: PAS domain S-box protein [Haloglomus sp.]